MSCATVSPYWVARRAPTTATASTRPTASGEPADVQDGGRILQIGQAER